MSIIEQHNSPLKIGIFDSGVGGISIAKTVKENISGTQIIYFADSKHAPYGEKSAQFIYQRCHFITKQLIALGCNLIVVACNTATVHTIAKLRQKFSVAFVGVEPGIKPAVLSSQSKRIALWATQATITSKQFQTSLTPYRNQAAILLQACNGLVEQVEENAIDSTKTLKLLNDYIQQALQFNADTIVLGCTHYPFLKNKIRQILPKEIAIISTEIAVAAQVKRTVNAIEPNELLNSPDTNHRVYINGYTPSLAELVENLWPNTVSITSFIE